MALKKIWSNVDRRKIGYESEHALKMQASRHKLCCKYYTSELFCPAAICESDGVSQDSSLQGKVLQTSIQAPHN